MFIERYPKKKGNPEWEKLSATQRTDHSYIHEIS